MLAIGNATATFRHVGERQFWAARAHVGSRLSGVSFASPLDREEPKITTDLLERYGCLLMLSARLHPEQAVRQEPLSIFGSSCSNHCEFRVGCYHAVMHKAVNQTTIYSAIDAVSIVSDRSFPRHSHDEFGIGIMEARGQYSWSGRGSVEARAGDVMTVNPGEIHDGLGTQGEARGWRMLYFAPDAISAFTDIQTSAIEIEHPVIQCRTVAETVKRAINAVTEPGGNRELADEQLMLAVRAVLRSDPTESEKPTFALSKQTLEVLAKIEGELDLPLSLDDFAKVSGLSRFQILRRFSKEVGATPHGYLTQLRVKRAKQAMIEGQSLAEAAAYVGFSDQSHMTRAFSRHFGTTPGRFLSARVP